MRWVKLLTLNFDFHYPDVKGDTRACNYTDHHPHLHGCSSLDETNCFDCSMVEWTNRNHTKCGNNC